MSTSELESLARVHLAELLDGSVAPDEIGPDENLTADLGLSSLNKVVLFTNLCEDTGVALTCFAEQDLARMTTLRQILTALEANEAVVR